MADLFQLTSVLQIQKSKGRIPECHFHEKFEQYFIECRDVEEIFQSIVTIADGLLYDPG